MTQMLRWKAKGNMLTLSNHLKSKWENSQDMVSESHPKCTGNKLDASCQIYQKKKTCRGISVTCKGNIILMQSDANSKDRQSLF